MSPQKAKPIRKLILLSSSSLIIFVVMLLMSNHSNDVAFQNFMRMNFGMTNRWSQSFGQEWLVGISRDIGALGGHIDFILITGFVLCFLFFLREDKGLKEFIFTIAGAIIILFILKSTLNINNPSSIFDIFSSDEFGFPSGHALMSFVLYTSLAKYSGKKLIYTNARYVIYIFAILLILLIGISRLFTSHTPTEVAAGWSAGIFWLSIVNYLFRKH